MSLSIKSCTKCNTEGMYNSDEIFCNLHPRTRLTPLVLVPTAEYVALQARIASLEAGVRRIVNGEYDNARTIDAAEKFARELLKGNQ